MQELVEQNLGLQVDKQQTRSDWLQRPLSDDQLHYAVVDVEHLVAIFEQLQQLHDKSRWSWFQEDMLQRANYREPQPQFTTDKLSAPGSSTLSN